MHFPVVSRDGLPRFENTAFGISTSSLHNSQIPVGPSREDVVRNHLAATSAPVPMKPDFIRILAPTADSIEHYQKLSERTVNYLY